MSKVIQCDACKKVDEVTRTFTIEARKGTHSSNMPGEMVLNIDVCKACYDKVLQTLGLEVVKKC